MDRVPRRRIYEPLGVPTSNLLRLVDQKLYGETLGRSDTKYGVEPTAMWDDSKSRNLVRIVVEVFERRPPSDWSQALATEVLLRPVC